MREISLDTETTGLKVLDGHKIIEIGCVEIIDRRRTGKVLHLYINPNREVSEGAFNVHGISNEFLKDKPQFSDIMDEFLEFLSNDTLIIHNAKFDLGFLNYELNILGRSEIRNPVKDTLMIARKMFPGSPANLDALCRKFDINLSAREKHGALLDAELLADVYFELSGGSQSSLALSTSNNILDKISIKQVDFPYREFKNSENEDEMHKNMQSKISNSLWKKIES